MSEHGYELSVAFDSDEPEFARGIVSAPLSFTGSAKRIWRALKAPTVWWRTTIAIVLIALAWCGVLVWYCSFGLLLVPYLLIELGGIVDAFFGWRERGGTSAEEMAAADELHARKAELIIERRSSRNRQLAEARQPKNA